MYFKYKHFSINTGFPNDFGKFSPSFKIFQIQFFQVSRFGGYTDDNKKKVKHDFHKSMHKLYLKFVIYARYITF